MVDFIGVGAQKSGTSWIYANLYEHPEICAPMKEIHFFSRSRFEKGKEWYESHFRACKAGTKKGEFSTSYLYSEEASKRIHDHYPNVKIIAVLRDPIDRTYSQYKNAIKAGEIDKHISFETYIEKEPSALEQGLYAEQLERYLELFPREQVLVLIYEDIAKDKRAFIEQIYAFLGVDPSFEPSMLEREINVARTPKHIWVEKIMHTVAESLRKIGLDSMVHTVRQSGLPNKVRGMNTKQQNKEKKVDRYAYTKYFSDNVRKLSQMLDRDLSKEWHIE